MRVTESNFADRTIHANSHDDRTRTVLLFTRLFSCPRRKCQKESDTDRAAKDIRRTHKIARNRHSKEGLQCALQSRT
jgi:hypothetical protein